MIRSLQRRSAGLAVSATILATIGLAGCGGIDGVELNGRLFDMLGVSSAAQEASKREPKMAPRNGLVLPPSTTAALPAPGSGGSAPDPGQDLRDPDRARVAAAAERQRLHKLYCSGELTWKERATNKEAVQTPTSPYGSCSLFGDNINDMAGATKKN
jgi:hypothetical protein